MSEREVFVYRRVRVSEREVARMLWDMLSNTVRLIEGERVRVGESAKQLFRDHHPDMQHGNRVTVTVREEGRKLLVL